MTDTTQKIDTLQGKEGPSSGEKAAVGSFAGTAGVAGPVTSFLAQNLSDTK